MRLTPSLLIFALVAALSLLAGPAFAQAITFDRLATALAIGDDLEIEGPGGTVAGRLAAIDPSELVLAMAAGGRATVAAGAVHRVRVRDSVANGAVAGAVAGALPGALVGSWAYRYCRNESSSPSQCWKAPVVSTTVAAGLGAVLGLVIDEAVERVWQVRAEAAPAVRAHPWVARGGGGLKIAIAF